MSLYLRLSYILDRFLLGVSGLAAIDMPYPLMKRWISLPQLYVGQYSVSESIIATEVT